MHRNNKVNSDKLSSRVVVYLWQGRKLDANVDSYEKEANLRGFSFGHVALGIYNEYYERNIYISFWPGKCHEWNADAEKDENMCQKNCSHFHGKKTDEIHYRRPSDDKITLYNLDVDAMVRFYHWFMKIKNRNWRICFTTYSCRLDKFDFIAKLFYSLIRIIGKSSIRFTTFCTLNSSDILKNTNCSGICYALLIEGGLLKQLGYNDSGNFEAFIYGVKNNVGTIYNYTSTISKYCLSMLGIYCFFGPITFTVAKILGFDILGLLLMSSSSIISDVYSNTSLTVTPQQVLDLAKELKHKELSLVECKKHPGPMKNRVGKAGARHWYTDTEIEKLFEAYISGNSEIEYLHAMLATNDPTRGNVFSDNLRQFNTTRMNAIQQCEVVKDRVLIPINLNQNHWALLYIIYSEDAANLPDIYYFDPFGKEASDELKGALQRGFSLRSLADVNIIPITRRVQNDGYNCGPWIVEAARAIAQNGSVTEESFAINQARTEHMKIIYPDAYPHESSQNQYSLFNEDVDIDLVRTKVRNIVARLRNLSFFESWGACQKATNIEDALSTAETALRNGDIKKTANAFLLHHSKNYPSILDAIKEKRTNFSNCKATSYEFLFKK